jgi:hypothetical protein
VRMPTLPSRQLAARLRRQLTTLRADRRFTGGIVLVLAVLLVAVLLQSRAAS